MLQTPVTSAPSECAIWTAKVPTPPDAPLIRILGSRTDLALAQALQGSERRDRNRGCLFERDTRRFWNDGAGLTRDDIVGECAGTPAEDFVAGLELRDFRADGLDGARVVDTQADFRGLAQPGPQAHEIRRAAHVVPVERIGGRRVNLDQDLVVAGHRLLDQLHLEHVGLAVFAIDDGPDRIRRRPGRGLVAGIARREVREREQPEQYESYRNYRPLQDFPDFHTGSPEA